MTKTGTIPELSGAASSPEKTRSPPELEALPDSTRRAGSIRRMTAIR